MTWREAEEAMHGGAIVRRACWPASRIGVVERGDKLFYGLGKKEMSRHREYRPSPDSLKATDWLVEGA